MVILRCPASRLISSLVVVATAVLLAAEARSEQIEFKVALDRQAIQPHERAAVEAVLTWRGAADTYSIEEWVAPEVSGVPLPVESDQVQTVVEAGQPQYRRRVVYVVRGEAPGTLTVASARVRLKGPGSRVQEYKTQPLTVTVTEPVSRWPSTDLLLALATVLLVGVVVAVSRRSRPGPPPPSRGQRARERVEALRSTGFRDHREFFDACLEALREGLARDWSIQIKDRDRERVVKQVEQAGFHAARCRAVDELITLCDEARFNPERPSEATRNRALTLLETVLTD
ncbi:MAG: hypothetical protein HY815_08180 [Candidatus Riflebacteria bacterium]|nr:hypothetical protein [Candidatus Riflebacteria bacterium]